MINPAKNFTLDEYIEILRRRMWYVIIPFVLVMAGASIYAITAPREYKASTLVLISPQKVPTAFVQTTVTSQVEERLQSIAQEVMSRTSLEKIITELRLYEKERKSLSKEETVELMRKNIKLELPTTKRAEKTGFFSLSFIGDDPNTVTTVANRLSSLFIEENLKVREQQASGTTEFMVNELAEAKAKLDKMEASVAKYNRRTTRVYDEPKIEYAETEKDKLKRELEALRTKYTDNHPDVIAMKKKIDDLEKNKDTSGSVVQVNKPRLRVEQIPLPEQNMGARGKEYESMKEIYEVLLKKNQEAQQAENLERRQKGEQFKVIDPAIVPEKPFSPDVPKILLISLFAGLASGLALAFVREQMDRSFHDADDVEISLGIKVLATIPEIEEKAS
jgi:uncharacterized protein involved in exopolysaccharide biosynthesis